MDKVFTELIAKMIGRRAKQVEQALIEVKNKRQVQDNKPITKEIIKQCMSTKPPIEESPYIHVVFCKGRNGWIPFTGYGCDISPKKTVEFINCINDAADVLNGKEDKK